MKKDMDVTFEICGSSGDGVTVLGEILSLGFARMGYHIFGFNSFPAEIRGFGRCIAHVRVASHRIYSLSLKSDVFISLDDRHSIPVIDHLKENGILVFENSGHETIPEGKHILAHAAPAQILYGFPFENISHETSGDGRNRNFVVLGLLTALFDLDSRVIRDVVSERFKGKSEKVMRSVLSSYQTAIEHVRTKIIKIDDISFPKRKADPAQKIMTGNKAVAVSSIQHGLKIYAGYPITPATSIFEHLIPMLGEAGGKYLQTEDEIAAVGTAIGAFYAGTRALTATSGPGLCLMSEFINFAVMAEQPLVIIDSQRGGPSTGLPTKTEQSDILAACFGSTGDSPRVVIAPSNIRECYTYIAHSYYIAEKYQTPVILLMDFFLSNRIENLREPRIDKKRLDGNIRPTSGREYRRYELTESGISPRALPGTDGFSYPITGLEHNEYGNPNYTSKNHIRMSEKRFQKLSGVLSEFDPVEVFGRNTRNDIGIISCGSVGGAAIETVMRLKADGKKAAALILKTIQPFPENDVNDFVRRCKRVIVVETNHQAQLAKLIRMHVCADMETMAIPKADPIHPEDIIHFVMNGPRRR